MQKDLQWFEFKDIIGKDINNSVWIPLWWHQTTKSDVHMPEIGHWEDFICTKVVAVSEEKKDELLLEDRDLFIPCLANESMRWQDVYFRADTYYASNIPIGENLVMYQEFGQKASPMVLINQDLIFALKLVEEEGNWIRPDEGYDVVIRQTRNGEGEIYKVEIQSKYLKDYLCARNEGAVFASFHQRIAVFRSVPDFGWSEENGEEKEISKYTRWNGYYQPMDDNGDVGLGEWSVFASGYKNIKTEDVPTFDPLNDGDEMYRESYETKGNPISRYQVTGELRKIEWIEPGKISVRVGGDKEEFEFYSEADGSLKKSKDLSSQPQWLWFKNDVINRILQFRGSNLSWYSAQTGSISLNADWMRHFGINKLGLINVFAKDIVELPGWQQGIWKGYNVTPDGGVSEELQMAQMQCMPAKTISAEDMFFTSLANLQNGFEWATKGTPLYKEALPFDVMRNLVHRFVVQKKEDVFRLAKDIFRYTIESSNLVLLWPQVQKPDEKNKIGSLKILERFLASFVSNSDAHDIMSPLFYLHDLRNADAHPVPQKDLVEIKEKLGITTDMLPIKMGERIISGAANAFNEISNVFQEQQKKQDGQQEVGI